MDSRTPDQTRTDSRVEFSRLLTRSMLDLDITQARLATHVGVTSQRVQRWCDHESPEVPGASDLRLFPRDLATKLIRWLVDGHHLAIVDELAPAESARDHLAEIQRIASADADVTTTYLGALADSVIDPAERRALIAKLTRAIEVETAALVRLQAEERAHVAMTRRNPNAPRGEA